VRPRLFYGPNLCVPSIFFFLTRYDGDLPVTVPTPLIELKYARSLSLRSGDVVLRLSSPPFSSPDAVVKKLMSLFYARIRPFFAPFFFRFSFSQYGFEETPLTT